MDDLCRRVAGDPQSVVAKVTKGGYLNQLAPGDLLVVLEGAATVEYTAKDRCATTLMIVSAGECMAPWGLKSPGVGRRIRVRALTPVVTARVSLVSVVRRFRDDAAAMAMVVLKLGAQQADLLTRLATVSERNAVPRVSEAVRYLQKKLGQACPFAPGAYIDVSQSEIARMAGQTRQTINGVLQRLRAAGILHLERGRICVRDVAGLDAAAQGAGIVRRFEPARSCRLALGRGAVECYPLRRAKAPARPS